MAQKELRNMDGKMMLIDRGVTPREEVNFVREYDVMHVDTFLSCWLREDTDVR